MASQQDVVITGLGVVSPIGIGRQPFWDALMGGVSGVGSMPEFDFPGCPIPFGARVGDFEPKDFVRPRKSLKVMARDIQLGLAAAGMATEQAGLPPGAVEPERLGVVFGSEVMHGELELLDPAYRACLIDGHFHFERWGEFALRQMFPLFLLKYLPNMTACHVAILQDARGPNNSVTQAEVSSLLALIEAVHAISRGAADVMIVGGTGSRLHPVTWVRSFNEPTSRRADRPAAASRPFDLDRDGFVNGEGAAAFVLERRSHAESRGARILGTVLASAARTERVRVRHQLSGTALEQAMTATLNTARLEPREVGHVNADGLSTQAADRAESQAIRRVLGDVPVTAPKSYFGLLGAGTGAVELAASLLALETGRVPPTLNFDRPDPDCPINVVTQAGLTTATNTALVVNQTCMGQAAAVLIAGPQA